MPIDENHFHVIVVQNQDVEKISSDLKLKNSEWCDWADANRQAKEKKKTDANGHYEVAIITNQVSDWNYIFCDKFKDLKYGLNCCNELSGNHDKIFYFSIDVHSGDYRFLKIENGNISRFFERNSNQETGEFGKPLIEELEIEKENKEHDYFHVIQIAKKILRLDLIKKSQLSGEKVLVGKRYYHEIEKYKNLYFEPAKPNNLKKREVSGDDLPF